MKKYSVDVYVPMVVNLMTVWLGYVNYQFAVNLPFPIGYSQMMVMNLIGVEQSLTNVKIQPKYTLLTNGTK